MKSFSLLSLLFCVIIAVIGRCPACGDSFAALGPTSFWSCPTMGPVADVQPSELTDSCTSWSAKVSWSPARDSAASQRRTN